MVGTESWCWASTEKISYEAQAGNNCGSWKCHTWKTWKGNCMQDVCRSAW